MMIIIIIIIRNTRKIITVYCENNAEHVTALCSQMQSIMKVETDGTGSNHWCFKGVYSLASSD
jgi:hypothetical protein